jgi:hypothetical protein
LLARYISPFLNTGMAFAFLQSFGSLPSWMDLLKMLVNNGLNSGANSFRILAEISSGPVALLASLRETSEAEQVLELH